MFSVVMPAHNTAAMIGDAVRSVIAQSDPDFELVVVDDGSTDGTADVVEAIADPRIRLVKQENRGAAAARNVGIAAGTGSLVAFVDSDDLWMPSYLGAMRRRFEEDPGLSLCYTDAWILDPETGRIGTATAMQWQRRAETPPADPAAFLLELLHRNFIYSAAVVRRSVIDEIGGFDENLPAAIDYEMWLRIVAHGHRAGQVSGLHAVYRRERPGSISSNSKRTFASLAVVFKKVADEYDVPEEAKVLARERAEVVQRELAALDGRLGLNSIWRARARPALVFLRNAVLRRDRWRRVPPPELAEAFPALLRPPGQGRAPGL